MYRFRVTAWLCVWWVLCAGPASAADTLAGRLPPGGFPDTQWRDPHPGKWTKVDVTQHGVKPGGGDVTAALKALIQKQPRPAVLYFPEGEYGLQKIEINRGDLIIQGAGPDKTTLRLTRKGTLFLWSGAGGKYSYKYLKPEFQPRLIGADVPAGAKEVRLSDTKGLSAGDLVVVEADLDQWSYESARRGRGGMFVVERVDAGKIVLDRPLAIGLPDIAADKKNGIVAKYKPVRNVGIRDLRIVSPEQPGEKANTLWFKRVQNGFVRNVESIDTDRHHVEIAYCHDMVVEDCRLDGSKFNGGGGYGYGVNVRDLSTGCRVANNIFIDLRHTMVLEVGASYNVFAYNLNVDRMRDRCGAPNPPLECKDEKWLNDKARNGMFGAFITADVAVHGNFPHHNLFEGNVFYNGSVDHSHHLNGPHFFFRNCALGQPKMYGGWQQGVGLNILGENDRQVLVGNVLRNDARIELQKHTYPRISEGSLIAGNVLKGKADWGAWAKPVDMPASLYLKEKPAFWTDGLAWPPFGPDVEGSATNKIPAQLRYEKRPKK